MSCESTVRGGRAACFMVARIFVGIFGCLLSVKGDGGIVGWAGSRMNGLCGLR